MHNKGFTLIELVIVIVILGILAATAAPKFLDLSTDARISVMKGVEAAVNSAADIAHAKAVVTGNTSAIAAGESILVGAETITLGWGWPTASDIHKLVDLSSESGVSVSSAGPAAIFEYTDSPNLDMSNDKVCSVVYIQSTQTNERPDIILNSDGC